MLFSPLPPRHSVPTTTYQDTCSINNVVAHKIHEDFKVRIHEYTTILPPPNMQETKPERKTCFLSNLDQDSDFPTPVLHFFSANQDFPIESVVEKLKTAVQKLLVPYDFVAGRLCHNHLLGRFEIECNGAGVGFVVASSEFSLNQIGDLACPNPGHRQLVFETLDQNNDRPLCIFQLTSFKCGGFAFGFTFNHIILDGNGAKMFLENLASQAFDQDKPLAIVPCNDRHLLAARSPPRVEFPHPELIPPPFDNKETTLVQDGELVKIFKLSSNQINYLKDKAKPIVETNKPIKHFSRFSVVAALVWRCKELSALDVENEINDDRMCTLNTAVDVRSRLNLPPSYCGNAVTYAYAYSKRLEFAEKPFSEIVELISDGITGLTGEYVRSTIDWYEINKGGRPNQGYFISSWWRIGFEKVVYPWGKPIYVLPIRTRNVCILLPSDHPSDEGVNAVVTLPAKEMDNFETLFNDFFKNYQN